MSVIDEFLAHNEAYAGQFTKGSLPMPPAKKLAAVVCMDARLETGVLIKLVEGDAHVIRNAGGVVTEDVIFLRANTLGIPFDCDFSGGGQFCLNRREFTEDGAHGSPVSLLSPIVQRPSVTGAGDWVVFTEFGFNSCVILISARVFYLRSSVLQAGVKLLHHYGTGNRSNQSSVSRAMWFIGGRCPPSSKTWSFGSAPRNW